ncbi:alpha/beta fold hydrolase [Aestuariibacter halophilus]|uniref:Alpha/beta fold hydrolase n=1 Tax=Fluctibacter halophilus TaxID=226011 RepID=A0ABS8G7B3_9ALTE|nr:alpha/beta fold hydrolase [Aestuariibacter halophilus]MCC2616482.1 alpha/beta fold hydrolase [Aestuariibacter halophilus]
MTSPLQLPPRLNALLESRAMLELGLSGVLMPLLKTAPQGDGHPVMVIPGFTTTDVVTLPMRQYLKQLGYRVEGWQLGANTGRDLRAGYPYISDRLLNRFLQFRFEQARPVSLIGWSLGGLLAREIARLVPDHVRQVITLGSPFANTHSSLPWIAGLFRQLNRPLRHLPQEAHQRLRAPLDVPTTAVYSRTDGIIHYRASCIPQLSPNSENIAVSASHLGMGHHPQVLWLLADRLAQADGHWRPFTPPSGLSWAFPRQRPRSMT